MKRSLSSLHIAMTFFNFLIVLFYASLILLSTQYIINNQLARDFLDQINSLPRNPQFVFFGSLFFFGVLVLIMYYRYRCQGKNSQYHLYVSFLEIIVCFVVIYLLYMGYNGIILLVFCDTIYHIKDNRLSKWLLVSLVIIYLLANYNVFSNFIAMPDITQYINVYDASLKGTLMVSIHILETLNIILFIIFMVVYLVNQIQENENISKELDMINQVNKELRNYASITEKIGEDNERKRLAREIHDTLGHALTGIAAGVDACIAMIDMNPQQTKQQLQVVSRVVRQGISDVRNSLNKLRPGALEEHSFKFAIEKMIEEFSGVSDIQIDFQYLLENVDFEKTKEDILFRIIQESITNALRHGAANYVKIIMEQKENMMILTIHDNGQGCEDIHYGYGLKQMQERVAIINGSVTYDGSQGFLTVVQVPMQRGEVYD